jgi:DNA-binding SARP family transcriptional activator
VDPRLNVTIIGEPAFTCVGRKVRTQSRKADALLAYLAIAESGQITRQSAAGLLWSESSEERARTSLRQAVKSIRRALDEVGFDGFKAEKEVLFLDLARVDIDLRKLIDAAENGTPPKLSTLHDLRHAERVLHECDDLDESYCAWVRVQRQVWSDLVMETLDKQFRQSKANRSLAESWAKALIAFDPSHEPATRYVMETRALQGDQSGALAAYNALWQTLQDEFDTEPVAETQKLNADIKLGLISIQEEQPPPPIVFPAINAEQGPILIVAAVPDSAQDSTLSTMLAGLRFELISLLVRFREWSVVDWANAGATGQRPTYAVLLSAHVQRDQFAYTLNLRNERDGLFIWGETVRGGIEAVYEAQEAFVKRMASALNIHLSADRLRHLPSHPVLPVSHFDIWVRAQQLMYRWRDAEDTLAFDLLHSIIRDIPAFGPAHSALAQHANGRHIVLPGSFRDPQITETALKHAQTARLLDPLDAKAHLSLGWCKALLGNFDEAENAYRDALQLNSNDPWVLTSATHGLAFCGARDETRHLARRILDMGVTLAPEQWSYLAGIHYLGGDYQACIEASRRVEHGYYGMKTWTISALAETGDADKAREEATGLYHALLHDWRAKDTPSPKVAGDWLADMFPIRNAGTRQRIRECLANAGFY